MFLTVVVAFRVSNSLTCGQVHVEDIPSCAQMENLLSQLEEVEVPTEDVLTVPHVEVSTCDGQNTKSPKTEHKENELLTDESEEVTMVTSTSSGLNAEARVENDAEDVTQEEETDEGVDEQLRSAMSDNQADNVSLSLCLGQASVG
jgi:hypothetical protein